MSAAVQVESTTSVPVIAGATRGPVTRDVVRPLDPARARELEVMAAGIEDAAAGLGLFLLLALFGVAFVIATLTGVLA